MVDVKQMDDQRVLACTIWGEARGHGHDGMLAIADVILNRVNSGITWWGQDVRGVCLKPFQFSCWNKSDPNLPKMLAVDEANPQFAIAMQIAHQALNEGLGRDITMGATHYYAIGTPQPAWAIGASPCAVHTGHLFFKGIA